MAVTPPRIEKPEDVPRVLEWYAYIKTHMTLQGADETNLRGEFPDAFVQAFTELFPDEEAPAARIPAEDTDTTFCVMVRKRLLQSLDADKMAKLRARVRELIEGEAQ